MRPKSPFVLWQYWRRADPVQVFALYLIGSGVARFFIEMLRINDVALLGLTQPQLWSAVSVLTGAALWLLRRRHEGLKAPAEVVLADTAVQVV